MRKRLAALVLATVSAATAVATSVSPAAARVQTYEHLVCAPGVVSPCVDFHSSAGLIRAVIDVTSGSTATYTSPVVVLYQCSTASASSCAPLSANSDVGNTWSASNEFVTSAKPFTRVHAYRAQASWTDRGGSRHVGVLTEMRCVCNR